MAEYDPPLVHLPGTVLTPEVVLHRTLNKVHRMQRRCVASSLATFSTPLLRCLSGAKWSGSASKRSEPLCSQADRWAPPAKSAMRAIAGYERALEKARADLSHVIACIAMFDNEATDAPRYADVHRLFRRGEMMKLAKTELAKGPADTRELARRIMAVKGFDTTDNVLAKAAAYRLVQALRMQHKRGTIGDAGRRNGVRVWALIDR